MRFVYFFAVLLFSFCVTPLLRAQDTVEETMPLWEIGVAGFTSYAPYYPAADESGFDWILLPYFIYRGDIFRFGDDSIAKGVIVENRRIEFDISLDASFDADSDDNMARQGMADLDYLFELGPQLTVNLGRFLGGTIEFALPARAVFSTDFGSVDYLGWVFNPELSYEKKSIIDRVDLVVELGSSFATEGVQDYFYQVDSHEATSIRRPFDAKGGYMGSELELGFNIRVTNRLKMFTGGQVAYYGGSANAAGPLFRSEFTYSVGVSFIWTFFQSDSLTIVH